jgi:hypothetical protein
MVGGCGLDISGSGLASFVGYCEHGNEPSGFIKGGEFLGQLSVLLAAQVGLCSMELVS